jgi:hypothetical protein
MNDVEDRILYNVRLKINRDYRENKTVLVFQGYLETGNSANYVFQIEDTNLDADVPLPDLIIGLPS